VQAGPVSVAQLQQLTVVAEQRIRPWITTTPLERSPLGPWLKQEHLQRTGSFKVRGAFNKLLALDPGTRARGVIAASTGNHGAAVAYAAAQLRCPARIVVPEGADAGKLAAIRSHGAELETHGTDSGIAEAYARRRAAAEGVAYVSPYNDPEVIAGQGTLGVELARGLERADAVFIALGGGGLLSGIAAWLRERWPGVRVIGCSPEHSAVMIESLRAGRILELPSRPTLSDGTAGGVEPDAITFPLCRLLGDEWVTVSETEILQAMRLLRDTHGMLVEGAAGVALAGYLRTAPRWRGQDTVVVLCGGNVSPAVFDA
jgi:threonine dehydratase